MSKTLYWLQCGGCGGDSMSLLCAHSPDLIETLKSVDIEILWHPSMSNLSPPKHQDMLDRLRSGQERLDILCLEGSMIRGPSGSGAFDVRNGQPKKDLVAELAAKAGCVIAVGTCAAFGGIGADGDIEACGVQFSKFEKGGLLGADFFSKNGLPVVNLPGCPCHPAAVTGTLAALAGKQVLDLNEFNSPRAWYDTLVHQGCTRNEYHEYRVEERDFGERGCLFFHMGCRGPLTYGPCNRILWNSRNCKTRAGVPCLGCTSPDFPQTYPFFETRNIEGIPLELPPGVSRAHYLAYKSMAAAAAPQRLKERITRI